MTAFDVAEVREFAASLDARLDRCDQGEGMECANLDDLLQRYAVLCCEFSERVREWGRAIFAGRAAFDPEVERVWLDEGVKLYRRANELWSSGERRNGECFVLEGGAALGSALWRLETLLIGWVTPKKAVAPLARLGLAASTADAEEVRKRIDALAPLPADWQPSDVRQRARLKMIQRTGRQP